MSITRHFELVIRCTENGDEFRLGTCEAPNAETAINNVSQLLAQLAHDLHDNSTVKDKDHE